MQYKQELQLFTCRICDKPIIVSVSSSCGETTSWKVHQLVSPQSTAEGLEPALRRQKAFHSPLLPVERHKLLGGRQSNKADKEGKDE